MVASKDMEQRAMNNKDYSNDETNYNYDESQNYYEDMPYKTLQEALALAKNAVQGEREDELFYDYLISVAPTKEEKDIITDIRNDEIKHNKMFREIYAFFTGEELPKSTRNDFKEPKSYIEGIKKAFFGELSAMERYRIIRAGLPSEYYRDMVFEILTDEMKHADKYNYILNLNLENMDHMGTMQTRTRTPSKEEDHMQDEMEGNIPEELLQYIEPIVNQALKEAKAGADLKYLFQKYILIGILIGNGFTAEQGVEQVKAWENKL
jgi:rubrerythrin